MPSIIELITQARLDEALEQLRRHPKYETDNNYQRLVTNLTSSYTGLREQEMLNLISYDTLVREKAKLTNSLLSLIRSYGVEDTVSGGDSPAPVQPLPKAAEPEPGAPRILFLASDPRDMGKLQLDKEFLRIHTELGDDVNKLNLKVRFEPRADTLTKTLLEDRPTYVHFAGHGVGAADNFHPAGIVLEDRYGNPNVVSGAALANMFRLIKKKINIKAVVLNACESAEQAKAISVHDIYTVGMVEEIPDNMAISFAGGFYLGLAESPDEIPFAFEMAINNLMMEGIEGEQVPKLFYRGEEVLF